MIAHWSDLHIGAADVRDEQVRRLCDHVIALHQTEPVTLAITGDLTESSRMPEWARLRALLEPVARAGVRLLPVPGNHDSQAMGIGAPSSLLRDRMDHYLGDLIAWDGLTWPRVATAGSVRILGLDSTAGHELAHVPVLARGRIGEVQLARLAALAPCADDVILLHHHPWWPDVAHVLDDAKAARKVLQRAGLVLYGHQHQTYQMVHGAAICRASCSTPRTMTYTTWRRETGETRDYWRRTVLKLKRR